METIHKLDALLFSSAVTQEELMRRWITWFNKIVPSADHRFLSLNQTDMHLDLLLRTIEDERAAAYRDGTDNSIILSHGYQTMLSRGWLLAMYETVRAAYKAAGTEASTKLAELYALTNIVRIPIAKGQIATVKGVKMSGIELMKVGSDDPSDAQMYDPSGRGYIPAGIFNPNNGSVGWMVIDVASKRNVEVTRREISDQLLTLVD